jgi:hypothetical protein
MDLGSGIRDPGSGIRDPEKTYSGSRIQGSKRHRIPDPDPQHCLMGGSTEFNRLQYQNTEKLQLDKSRTECTVVKC